MVDIASAQNVVKQAIEIAREIDDVGADIDTADLHAKISQISSMLATTKINLAEIKSTHDAQQREIDRLTTALEGGKNP
ncbi:MAG: hypothetical protein COA62_07060 [Rhodobiaceae bacterium]|nr:MAG: hypothetical protein COA62_07060 [Rhodobiaceae bacterium]